MDGKHSPLPHWLELLGQVLACFLQAAAIAVLFAVAAFASCSSAAGGELVEIDLPDVHTVQRFQPCQRIQWQWVPPQNLTIGGRVVSIPGHWHNRFAACAICGDRTQSAGSVAQANPGLSKDPPTPASASHAQAASQPHDAQHARLAADLAGVRGEVEKLRQEVTGLASQESRNWRAADERITRNEQSLASHAAALEAVIPAAGRVEELAGGLERLTARADRDAKAVEADRRGLGARVRSIALAVVSEKLAQRIAPTAIQPLLQTFLAGSPYGLGLAAMGWFLGRAIRRRRTGSSSLLGWLRGRRGSQVEVELPPRPPARPAPQVVIEDEPAPPAERVIVRRRTENEYVEKPLTDEGEAYKEAIRREARTAKAEGRHQVIGHLERVEATAAQLLGRQPAEQRPAWKQD